MTFTQRLAQSSRLVARAAVGLFSDRSATEAHGLLMGVNPGTAGAPAVRGSREMLLAYSHVPWLRAVTDKIASALAEIQWTVSAPTGANGKAVYRPDLQRMPSRERQKALASLRRTGELRELVRHPFYDVMATGNSALTGLATRKVTFINDLILGEWFWLKERNGTGAPVGVWPIPSHWIMHTPTPSARTYRVGYRAWQEEIPDTEILWHTDPNPENPYARGTGIAQALSDEYESDEFAARTIKAWFANSAKPDLIVHGKGLSEAQALRAEREWNVKNRGFMNRWRAHFLGGGDLKITELDTDMRSSQMFQLRGFAREIALQTWGMPPEMLGILESSNRATIESADFFFARRLVEPRAEMFRAALQEKLIPEWDERLVVDFVSPVEEDKAHRLEVMKAAPWAYDVDRWREETGDEPLDGNAGKVYLVPFNLTPMADLTAPPPAPEPATPPAASAAGAPPDEDEAEPKAARATWKAQLHADAECYAQAKDTEAARWAWKELGEDPTSLPALSRMAARLEPALRAAFLAAVTATRAEVELEALARGIAAGLSGEIEAAVQLAALEARLGALLPVIRQGFLVGAESATASLTSAGVGLRFDLVSPHAVLWAQRHAGALITGIVQEQRRMVAAAVAQGLQQGQGAAQVAAAVRGVLGLTSRGAEAVGAFRERLLAAGTAPPVAAQRTQRYAEALGRQRAALVARTELIASLNGGQQAAWQEARAQGLLVGTERRVWETAEDERVCPVCMALDGETRGLGEAFTGGVLHPGAHPACRCSVSLVFG